MVILAVEDPPAQQPAEPAPPAAAPRPAGTLRHRLRRDGVLVALMIPGIAWLVVFPYGAAFGNVLAFKDYFPFLGVWTSPWVGLQHFERLLGDDRFWNATANTVTISLLQILFFFPAALGLALLLHSIAGSTVKRWVQSVVYLPHFLSWVIVVALFTQMLGGAGVLNGWLAQAGLDPVQLIGNAEMFKPLVIVQMIWKECGWGTIIFLAALMNVDEQLYEAAAMDGSGWWRRLWHVTLPSIRPVVMLLLILKLGEILSVGFEQFFLQRDAVGPEAGEVIDTFVFFTAFQGGDMGYAAAAGLFKGLVGAVLIYTANKVAHRLGEQGVYTR
ncbi:ABC transporter permease [Catellatospora vulcania]|uniref:ABC transporter permease n=1 Tax=Catellatospora vulcania TaxID=1460450 RepID=UPI001E4236D3|nr:ABC transporter permease subunit [Catellatospora vulcania]